MRRLSACLVLSLAVVACNKNSSKPKDETPPPATSAPAARLSLPELRGRELPADIEGLASLEACAKTYGQKRSFAECGKGNAGECFDAYGAVSHRDTACRLRLSLQGCRAGNPTLCSYGLAPEVEAELAAHRTELELEAGLVVAAYVEGCRLGDAKGCMEVARRVPGTISADALAAHVAWACQQRDPFACHQRAIALWPSRRDPAARAAALEAQKLGCAVGSEGRWIRDSCLAAALLQPGDSPELGRLSELCVRDAAIASPAVCLAVARRLGGGAGAALWRNACEGLEASHPWSRDCPEPSSSDEELVTRLLLAGQ